MKFSISLMAPEPSIRDELLTHAPWLRRFALSLCGTIDCAEDLVQETFLLALSHLDSFKPGTNLAAWLATILRNRFRDQFRRRQREVEDADGHYSGALNSQPEQSVRIDFSEFRAALGKLPPKQREALILLSTTNLSYPDVAARCGCATGTLKSRVHRARARLIDLLAIDSPDDFGPDRTMRAIMANCPISPWR